MERFRAEEDDATKGLVGANTSRYAKRETMHQTTPPDDEVTCEALHLALSAIHLDIAWHTGVISVEAAMESLHREIVETVSRCTWSNQIVGPRVSRRSPLPATATRPKTLCRQKTDISLSRLMFGDD